MEPTETAVVLLKFWEKIVKECFLSVLSYAVSATHADRYTTKSTVNNNWCYTIFYSIFKMMNRRTVMIIMLETLSALIAFVAFYLLMIGIGRILNIHFSYMSLFHFGYIGMVSGISIVGYNYFKQTNIRKKLIFRLLISLLGVFSGSYFYYLVSLQLFGKIPFIYTAWILPIILPLIGALLGFNYRKYE
jgi:hypothetical protein